jgi:hypothetical protein
VGQIGEIAVALASIARVSAKEADPALDSEMVGVFVLLVAVAAVVNSASLQNPNIDQGKTGARRAGSLLEMRKLMKHQAHWMLDCHILVLSFEVDKSLRQSDHANPGHWRKGRKTTTPACTQILCTRDWQNRERAVFLTTLSLGCCLHKSGCKYFK